MEEAQASAAGAEAPLSGGHLLAAISNRIVQIQREHYGRGPMKAKTYALDDLVIVVMRGTGFTPLEKTMLDSGDPDRIVEIRHDFQHMMTKRFTDSIEELTSRKVLAFLSQAHIEPDISLEIFFVDGPLEGFGAVEVVHPDRRPGPPGFTHPSPRSRVAVAVAVGVANPRLEGSCLHWSAGGQIGLRAPLAQRGIRQVA